MEVFFIILLLLLFNTYLVKALNNRFNIPNPNYLWLLFSIHFIATIAYILYAYATRSDSFFYYEKATRDTEFFSFFVYGTPFINFLAWPLVKLLSLSYLSVMIIFSYFGFLGVVFFYLSTIENVKLNTVWNNLSAAELIFLLPNIHFWSSSLGKGATILFGLGLFCFGLSRFDRRIAFLAGGSFFTLMVRPHIFLTLVTSLIIGVMITRSGIKPYIRWLLFSLAIILFLYISQDVLTFTQSESLDIFSSSNISHRAEELSKSNSGVDIKNYSLFMKMFSFWFRPLFVDATGPMGLIVSFENVFLFFIFFYVIRSIFISWNAWNGWFRISIFIFLLGSFILAQVTGNLGIAIRQKAQFMPFLYILYCKAVYNNQYFSPKKLAPQ